MRLAEGGSRSNGVSWFGREPFLRPGLKLSTTPRLAAVKDGHRPSRASAARSVLEGGKGRRHARTGWVQPAMPLRRRRSMFRHLNGGHLLTQSLCRRSRRADFALMPPSSSRAVPCWLRPEGQQTRIRWNQKAPDQDAPFAGPLGTWGAGPILMAAYRGPIVRDGKPAHPGWLQASARLRRSEAASASGGQVDPGLRLV